MYWSISAPLCAGLRIDVKDGAQPMRRPRRVRPAARSSSPMTFEWTASVSAPGSVANQRSAALTCDSGSLLDLPKPNIVRRPASCAA